MYLLDRISQQRQKNSGNEQRNPEHLDDAPDFLVPFQERLFGGFVFFHPDKIDADKQHRR